MSALTENAVAVPCGRYKGRRFYRVPVHVAIVNTDTLGERRTSFLVIAPSAADAANYARDLFARVPCTNISAIGPRGATVRRFVGWESAIAARMFDRTPEPVQLRLWEGAP